MPIQPNGPHGCIILSNTPDALADNWTLLCECGYRVTGMIDVSDAITMFGLHCMEQAIDMVYRGKIDDAATDRPDYRAVVRDDRGVLRRLGLRRRPQPPQGPQAPPRHLSLLPPVH